MEVWQPGFHFQIVSLPWETGFNSNGNMMLTSFSGLSCLSIGNTRLLKDSYHWKQGRRKVACDYTEVL